MHPTSPLCYWVYHFGPVKTAYKGKIDIHLFIGHVSLFSAWKWNPQKHLCVACFGLSQFSIGHGQLGICSQVIGPSRWLSLEGSRLAKAQRGQWGSVYPCLEGYFFHLSHNIHVCSLIQMPYRQIRRSRTMSHRHVCMASEYLFLDPFSPVTSRFIVPTAYPHLDAHYTIQMLNV